MMKSLLTTTLMIIGLSLSHAQVVEVQQNMSQGVKNGLTINLDQTDVKTVEASWLKFVKSYKGKSKKNKKTKELFTDNAMIKNMSTNTVDIYSMAEASGTDVKFTAWFDLGGAYIDAASQADAYAVAQSMLTEFSTSVSIAAVEFAVEMEEKTLSKMESEMKSLLKENLSLEEEIVKCEKKIEEAKMKIEENKSAQGVQQKEIDGQMEKVKMTKDKLKKF